MFVYFLSLLSAVPQLRPQNTPKRRVLTASRLKSKSLFDSVLLAC